MFVTTYQEIWYVWFKLLVLEGWVISLSLELLKPSDTEMHVHHGKHK